MGKLATRDLQKIVLCRSWSYFDGSHTSFYKEGNWGAQRYDLAICQKTTGFYPHSFPGPLFRREAGSWHSLGFVQFTCCREISQVSAQSKKAYYWLIHNIPSLRNTEVPGLVQAGRQPCSFPATERPAQAAHACMMNSSQEQSGINLVNHSCHSKYSSSTRLFDARLLLNWRTEKMPQKVPVHRTEVGLFRYWPIHTTFPPHPIFKEKVTQELSRNKNEKH